MCIYLWLHILIFPERIYYYFEPCWNSLRNITFSHGRKSNVSYECVGFGLNYRFIVHSPLIELMIIICSGVLANSHSCSLHSAIAITYTLQFTEHRHRVLLVCCPGTGFQRPTFPFLCSRTLSLLQPQQHLTRCALTGTPSWSSVR
jgi:hypothetical protein